MCSSTRRWTRPVSSFTSSKNRYLMNIIQLLSLVTSLFHKENPACWLIILLVIFIKLMVIVQQVEREGKMLTKAALTMPQVNQSSILTRCQTFIDSTWQASPSPLGPRSVKKLKVWVFKLGTDSTPKHLESSFMGTPPNVTNCGSIDIYVYTIFISHPIITPHHAATEPYSSHLAQKLCRPRTLCCENYFPHGWEALAVSGGRGSGRSPNFFMKGSPKFLCLTQLRPQLFHVSDGLELPHSHLLFTRGLSPWPSSGSSQSPSQSSSVWSLAR